MSKNSFFESVLSLSVVQAANFIAPILAIPVLTRTLGTDAWGQVSFALFAMQFLLVLTDYGFSLSAVRRIAESQDDKRKIAEIFSACWTVQWLILAVLSILAVVFTLLSKTDFRFLVGLALVFGNVLFPIWYFQGIERLKAPAIIQLFARIILLALMLGFVRAPEDLFLALLLLSAHNVLAGALLLPYAYFTKLLEIRVVSISEIILNLKDGFGIFVSKIFISSYTTAIPLVLGVTSGTESVGYYYVADKIRVAASYVLTPISLALFPRASSLISHNREDGLRLIVKLGKGLIFVSAVFSMVLFLFSDTLIKLASGSDFGEAQSLLRIMAITPLIVSISNVVGVQILLPLKKNREFNRSIQIAGGITLALIWPATALFHASGAAFVSVFAEILVTVGMIFYLHSIRSEIRL